MLLFDNLKKEFNNIDFREKRPGVFKVIIPFFYEDGDMYDIFIEEHEECIRISDYGLTLMKLSYTFDIDTKHKKEMLETLILQNRCKISTGNIYLDVSEQQFTGGIYQFVQTLSKVSNMEIIIKESVKSYFYELLDDFIKDSFKEFNVKKDYIPIQSETDYKIDYFIPHKRPIYVFGVNDNPKASKVIITCLGFISHKIPHRSLIVHEDFESLSAFNRNQITNIADKQFTRLDGFKESGVSYLNRELAVM